MKQTNIIVKIIALTISAITLRRNSIHTLNRKSAFDSLKTLRKNSVNNLNDMEPKESDSVKPLIFSSFYSFFLVFLLCPSSILSLFIFILYILFRLVCVCKQFSPISRHKILNIFQNILCLV